MKITKELILEIEDIQYGLEKGYELEPTFKRINSLKKIITLYPNKEISEMISVWEENHGVLPKQERILAIKQILSKLTN